MPSTAAAATSNPKTSVRVESPARGSEPSFGVFLAVVVTVVVVLLEVTGALVIRHIVKIKV